MFVLPGKGSLLDISDCFMENFLCNVQGNLGDASKHEHEISGCWVTFSDKLFDISKREDEDRKA